MLMEKTEIEVIKKDLFDDCFFREPDSIDIEVALVHRNEKFAVVGIYQRIEGSVIAIDVLKQLNVLTGNECVECIDEVQGCTMKRTIYKIVSNCNVDSTMEIIPSRAFGLRRHVLIDNKGNRYTHEQVFGYGNNTDGYHLVTIYEGVPKAIKARTEEGTYISVLYI